MAVDTEKTTTLTGFTVSTGISRGVPPHIFKTLLFAQTYKKEWYEKNLAEILENQHNPDWNLKNPEFVRVLEELASRFELEFAEQFPPEEIENTIPQDVVDNLVETYESEHPKTEHIREESERIAREYVAELKRRGITLPEQNEQQIRNRIRTGVEGALTRETLPDAFTKQAARILEGELSLAETQKHITNEQYQAARQKATQTVTPALLSSWKRVEREESIKSGVLKAALSAQKDIENTHRPDLAAAIFRQLSHEDADPAAPGRQKELISEASKLARAAEPLMVAVDPTKSPDIAGAFISSLAKPGRENAVSTLVSLMTPQQKERVAAGLLREGFEKLMANNELLSKRLGSAFVSSPVFAMISENARKSIVGGQVAAVAQGRAVLSDLAGSVFRGPLKTNLVFEADQPVMRLIEMMSLNQRLRFKFMYQAVSGEYMVPGPGPVVPHLPLKIPTGVKQVPLEFIFEPRQFALRSFLIFISEKKPEVFAAMAEKGWFTFVGLGTKSVAKKAAAGTAAKAVVKTGVWAGFTRFILGKTAGTAIGAVLGTILGGPVGAAVGWAVTLIGGTIIGKSLGWLWNKIKFGGFVPNLNALVQAVNGFLGGRAKTTPWNKDPSIVGPALLMGIVILIPMYSSSFMVFKYRGAGMISTAVQQFTETISESGARPAPGGSGPSFSYSGPPPPASAGITTCPVSGGSITQVPYEAGESHANLNAYDFGGLAQGSPVYAAHDGYVVSYRNTFAPNQYQYGSYGNYVLLVGTTQSGVQFFTIYAHLMPNIPAAIIAAAGTQTLITAGTQVGELDTTGYTYGWRGVGTGTHLHFGYQGPGLLTLPPGCP